MGFVVVHMQKIKAGGVKGIQSHNNRERRPRTNPDIDTSRSAENYDLVQSSNYSKTIKSNIEKFATETKTVRKDAVVYCSFIVTSDEQTMKSMTLDKQKAFFEDSVRWFARRYGAENIVNATVHMDETTPHMHIGITPIANQRLSAKAIFDKKELTSIQTDFAKEVGEQYGLERGKEGSERTHLSETRFKLQTAEKSLEKAKTEYRDIRSQTQELSHKENENIKALIKEKKSLEGQIRALEGNLKAKELQRKEILAIKPECEKGLFGSIKGIKGVTLADIENLKATAIKGLNACEQLEKLTLEYEKLKKSVPSLNERMNMSKDKIRLQELEQAFTKLPKHIREQLLPQKTTKSKDIEL